MTDNKAQILGMPIGTASNRLKKSIMFSLLQRLDENWCYRCGTEILIPQDLSIDHAKDWVRSKKAEDFWDLSNVKYSHKVCNTKGLSNKVPISREEALVLGIKPIKSKVKQKIETISRPKEKFCDVCKSVEDLVKDRRLCRTHWRESQKLRMQTRRKDSR